MNDLTFDARLTGALCARAEAAVGEFDPAAVARAAIAGAYLDRRRIRFQRVALLATAAVLLVATMSAYALGVGPFRPAGSTPVPLPSEFALETPLFTYRVPDSRAMRFVTPGRPGYLRMVLGEVEPYEGGGDRSASVSRGIVVAQLITADIRFATEFGENIGLSRPDVILEKIAAGGALVGEAGSTVLDGHAGLLADIAGADDRVVPLSVDVRGAGQSVHFYVPSRVFVLDVDGDPWLIQIWGASDDVLAEWLPTATQIVESIHFTEGR